MTKFRTFIYAVFEKYGMIKLIGAIMMAFIFYILYAVTGNHIEILKILSAIFGSYVGLFFITTIVLIIKRNISKE